MYDQIQKNLDDLRVSSQQEINAICKVNALGLKGNQQMFVEIEQVQTQLIDNQLHIIETVITTTSRLDMESQERLQSLKKELQKELVEIQKQGFRNRLSDLEQDFEERVAVGQASFAIFQISQQDFYDSRCDVYCKFLRCQLTLVRLYISVAKDPDFLDSLKRKEVDILTKGV